MPGNLKQTKGGDLSLRTTVNLPNGSGKKSKVAVLCEQDKIEEAKKSGADIVGSEDLIEKIAAGNFNFTKLISVKPDVTTAFSLFYCLRLSLNNAC